jgi:prepilin-type N-terminal cleavage/methylation domain-containing protein
MRHFRTPRAFTLIEIMIAILFISIGFFGYVALHSRLLHSGQKLEEREKIRASTSLRESVEVGRLMLGIKSSVTGRPYEPATLPQTYVVSTESGPEEPRDWLQAYPPEYSQSMTPTVQMSPVVPSAPFQYSWESY